MTGQVASLPDIDIGPAEWSIVRAILGKHVPQFDVWAFGSRATRRAKAYSDLDLAVITSEPLTIDVMAALTDDFSTSDLPWKVDVLDWAQTSDAFRQLIQRDHVRIQAASA